MTPLETGGIIFLILQIKQHKTKMTDTQLTLKDISKNDFENYWYNQKDGDLIINNAEEILSMPVKKLDFIHENFEILKETFIDGIRCRGCFEILTSEFNDIGEHQSEVIYSCKHCGE